MKVLLVSNMFPPYVMGGAEVAAHSLALCLRHLGHDVHVLTGAPRADQETTTVDASGFIVERRYFHNLYQVYRAQESNPLRKLVWHAVDHFHPCSESIVTEVIRRVQPDLINLHDLQGIGYNLVRAVARSGLPCIQVLHDFGLICANMNRFRGGSSCRVHHAPCRASTAIKTLYYKDIARLAYWSPSEAMLEEYKPFLPAHASMQAIPLPLYFRGPASAAHNRVDGGTPLRLLFVGQVVAWKGIQFVIEVLSDLAQLYPGAFVFDVVGGGAELQPLRDMFVGAEWLRFHGKLPPDEVGEHMARSSLLLVPSLWFENAPLVISQAIRTNLPVFASRAGGLPELVKDGLNGRLIASHDKAAWRSAIEQVLHRPALVDEWRAGSDSWRTRFLPEVLGKQVGSLFETTAGRTHRAQAPSAQVWP